MNNSAQAVKDRLKNSFEYRIIYVIFCLKY